MYNTFPEVLILAPTSGKKEYCFKSWLDNVMQFTYPNFRVVLFDNSINGSFAEKMNRLYKESYGASKKFVAVHSKKVTHEPSLQKRILISTNDCRDYFLTTSARYFFSLETDVFPERQIIEELMFQQKDVIGALYDRDWGSSRKLCIQSRYAKAPNFLYAQNFSAGDEINFVDGNAKEVASVGLGCVLIKRQVIEKIPFRIIAGYDGAPDMYFSEDCFRQGIKIYAHTGMYCAHKNEDWGIFGVNYK